MSGWAVMVRDDNDECEFYGPFRSAQRASDLAALITQEIDKLDPDYEGPAWAYPVHLGKSPHFKVAAISAWDPDAIRLPNG